VKNSQNHNLPVKKWQLVIYYFLIKIIILFMSKNKKANISIFTLFLARYDSVF